jgi:hypothetical protein
MLEVPGLDYEEGQVLSHSNLHPKPTTKGLVHIWEHPWVLGQATGTLTHMIHHGPNSGEATTFPHIVFSTALRRGYIQMALFLGTPKKESRNYPGLESRVGVSGLWELISLNCNIQLERGLNQSCSSPQEHSNVVSHSFCKCGKRSIPDF